MCAAKMVMQNLANNYTGILIRAGLRVPLMTGYVDDGRQGWTTLRKGMRFDDSMEDFVIDQKQLEKDLAADEPDNVRMARICLPAINNVNKDLKFKTEAPAEFAKKRLPTVDCVIWLVEGINLK